MSLDLIHKAVAKLPVAARRRFAAAVVAAVGPDKPGAVERAVNAPEAVRLKALQDTCPEAFAAVQAIRQTKGRIKRKKPMPGSYAPIFAPEYCKRCGTQIFFENASHHRLGRCEKLV